MAMRNSRILFAGFAAVTCIVPRVSIAQETPESIIREVWASQENEIFSAYVRARLFRAWGKSLRSHSSQHIAELFSGVSSGDEAKTYDELVAEFNNTKESPAVVELFVEGDRVRREIHTEKDHRVRVFDGDVEIKRDRANKQVLMYQGGVLAREKWIDLSDLRVVPPAEVAAGLTVVSRAAGIVEFKYQEREGKLIVVADESNGLLSLMRVSHADKVLNEVYQVGGIEYPSGVVFPTIVVHCGYGDDQLNFVDCLFIEDAWFNRPHEADTFEVASFEDGTNVFDYRNGVDRKPEYSRVEQAVPDIRQHVDLPDRRTESVIPRSGYSSILIVINVIVVVAVLAATLGGRWLKSRG